MLSLKDITILVVDDEQVLREAVVENLKYTGFTVLSASCGREALEIVKSSKVDLVLSDIRMPNGDGMFLLEQIRALNTECPPLIFVTGGSPYAESECLERGAKKILSKPFDREILLCSILDVLNLPRSQAAA